MEKKNVMNQFAKANADQPKRNARVSARDAVMCKLNLGGMKCQFRMSAAKMSD